MFIGVLGGLGLGIIGGLGVSVVQMFWLVYE